jgi:predicted MFS family arabinose efflux permease
MTQSNHFFQEQRSQEQRIKLWVLLAAGSLTVMPGAVIIPVLGEIKREFYLTTSESGWLASAHYSMVALFSPLLGILAIRIGWVRVLVGSLLLFSLFGIAGIWTTSYPSMLLTRLLLGAATGGIAAASLGILAQMYQREAERTQAIALASSTISLANIAYPLMAGLIGVRHWRSAFYIHSISIPVAVVTMLYLSNRRAKADSPQADSQQATLLSSVKLKHILSIVRHPQVVRFLVGLLLTSATAFATVSNLSIYLRNSHLNASTVVIGVILAAQAIGAATVAAFGLKYLTRRFGTVPAMGIGFGLMATMLVAMPNANQAALLLPVAFLFGVGLGIVIPSHYDALASITPAAAQSVVLAIGSGMTFLGQFISPGLFSGIVQRLPTPLSNTPTTVFYVAGTVALLAGAMLIFSSRQLVRLESAED